MTALIAYSKTVGWDVTSGTFSFFLESMREALEPVSPELAEWVIGYKENVIMLPLYKLTPVQLDVFVSAFRDMLAAKRDMGPQHSLWRSPAAYHAFVDHAGKFLRELTEARRAE